MNKKLLDITPKRYLCPNCGKWHRWFGRELNHYSENYPVSLTCFYSDAEKSRYRIYFPNENTICYQLPKRLVGEAQEELYGALSISSLIESEYEPIVTFDVTIGHITKTLGFEFDKSEYDAIVNPEAPETKLTTKKEVTNMEKTSVWSQLYEHSPKENVEIVKEWGTKYKSTLKWAVPVVAIYSAYRILNAKDSKLTVDNVDSECEKKLGFKLDCLKDKSALNQLLILGGLSAGAYAAIKGVSAIYGKDTAELDVDDLQEGMEQLDGAKKKFGWIQPKTEKLLPVATSVIIVYVMTQKPAWFDAVKEKASKLGGGISDRVKLYSEMIKLFVADKLHLDLEEDEDVQKFKKFTFLAAIAGIGLFLFGKKILGNKAALEEGEATGKSKNEKLEAFMDQILSIMKKLMPSAFTGLATILVTKKILKEDVIDGDFVNEFDEDDNGNNNGDSNDSVDDGKGEAKPEVSDVEGSDETE